MMMQRRRAILTQHRERSAQIQARGEGRDTNATEEQWQQFESTHPTSCASVCTASPAASSRWPRRGRWGSATPQTSARADTTRRLAVASWGFVGALRECGEMSPAAMTQNHAEAASDLFADPWTASASVCTNERKKKAAARTSSNLWRFPLLNVTEYCLVPHADCVACVCVMRCHSARHGRR